MARKNKKREAGSGSITKRKDGRWEGRVVIGYDEKNLPKTKNVLAKTKSECVEKLKQLQEQYAPPKSDKIKLEMPFGECVQPHRLVSMKWSG